MDKNKVSVTLAKIAIAQKLYDDLREGVELWFDRTRPYAWSRMATQTCRRQSEKVHFFWAIISSKSMKKEGFLKRIESRAGFYLGMKDQKEIWCSLFLFE